MNNLSEKKCPNCKETMINNNEDVKTAQTYDDCIRKCLNCQIGYSNARYNPKIIYQKIEDNITECINNKKIKYILNNSLNIRNRPNKLKKASFATSEDALTFSFINYLIENDQITKFINLIDSSIKISERINIYLWGVNIIDNDIEKIEKMKKILINTYYENANSLTEPDIIISGDDFTIIIEVKYKSQNEVKNTNTLRKYIRNNYYENKEKAIESEHYELIRNWTILNEIENHKGVLINLGDDKTFNNKKKEKLNCFEDSLNQNSNRMFKKLTWKDIIQSDIYFTDDMENYLKKKIST